MQTMQAFCRRYRIAVKSCEMIGENPNAPDWRDAYHYRVTLRARVDGARHQMTVYFSMGYGHNGEPEAHDVLSCLASDSASIHNARSFEEWASDLGYDADSRKAERIYKACERQYSKLQAFLGGHAFSMLLFNTEPL